MMCFSRLLIVYQISSSVHVRVFSCVCGVKFNQKKTALFWLAEYGVETAIVSKTGKLVATIVPSRNEARGDTRLKQYEAYFNRKGVEIAGSFIDRRVESEISVMEKHDMNTSKIENRLPTPKWEANKIEDIRQKIRRRTQRKIQDIFQ